MSDRSAQPAARGTVVLAALGALAVVSLVLAEVGLRVLERFEVPVAVQLGRRDPFAVIIEPHGTLGYRQRPGAALKYWNGTVATANSEGYRGPVVELDKPAKTFRVVLLGESTTHGWGVSDDQTIDSYLRERLTGAPWLAGRSVEVVNLAYDGYDAYQIFERLGSDGITREPDVIIVNTGVNDVRNAKFNNLIDRDPRTLIWEAELVRLRRERSQGSPSLWVRTKHWSYLARLPSLLRQLARRPLAMSGATSRRAAPIANREALDGFERNLRRIDSLASTRDIPVLYSTPPSVIDAPGAPPTGVRDYYLASTAETQSYRDSLSGRMQLLVTRLASSGRNVRFVPHSLGTALFLDDCHLKPEGNRQMATDFFVALESLVGTTFTSKTP